MRLNAILTPTPGNQLWGIYYTDREYAREHGDPLRTVIEAPTMEQTSRISAVIAQLESWRDELQQQRRHRVSHRV